jgi:hypothetical protein
VTGLAISGRFIQHRFQEFCFKRGEVYGWHVAYLGCAVSIAIPHHPPLRASSDEKSLRQILRFEMDPKTPVWFILAANSIAPEAIRRAASAAAIPAWLRRPAYALVFEKPVRYSSINLFEGPSPVLYSARRSVPQV